MKILVEGEEAADAISVTGGQQSRVIEINMGAVFAVNGHTGNVQLRGLTDWINAADAPYNAPSDGIGDPTTAIQAAIDACPPGGRVYLPAGLYATTSTLDLKNGVSLVSDHANLMTGPGMTGNEYPCSIQPAADFEGTAVIQIIGDNDGTHPNISAEQRLTNVMIDGSKLGGSSIDGLYARGNVQNVVLEHVTIKQMPNNGIVTAPRGDGTFPFSWRLHHVMVDTCHANGLLLTSNTDITLDDVQAIGCWGQGIILENCPNAQLAGCRTEWNGSHGYHITGDWGDWAGSGGMQMTGCSTDRNGQHGVFIDATGNPPIAITGLQLRRDGRNGGDGGGSYAGLAVIGATVPVTIDGVTCYPGVDDGGSTTNSPQYGLRLSGAATVLVDNAILHAATTGLSDDGTNTLVHVGAVVTATGDTTATNRTLVSPVADPTFLPADHGLITWTHDPATLRSASNATTSGTVYLCKVKIMGRATVSKISVGIETAGSGLTSGQSYVGLYDSSGNRLAVSADQSGNWTAAGMKTIALTASQALAPGNYYVAILSVGTTPPQFSMGAGGAANINVGLASGAGRFLTGPASQTSLPATIALASQPTTTGARWAALS